MRRPVLGIVLLALLAFAALFGGAASGADVNVSSMLNPSDASAWSGGQAGDTSLTTAADVNLYSDDGDVNASWQNAAAPLAKISIAIGANNTLTIGDDTAADGLAFDLDLVTVKTNDTSSTLKTIFAVTDTTPDITVNVTLGTLDLANGGTVDVGARTVLEVVNAVTVTANAKLQFTGGATGGATGATMSLGGLTFAASNQTHIIEATDFNNQLITDGLTLESGANVSKSDRLKMQVDGDTVLNGIYSIATDNTNSDAFNGDIAINNGGSLKATGTSGTWIVVGDGTAPQSTITLNGGSLDGGANGLFITAPDGGNPANVAEILVDAGGGSFIGDIQAGDNSGAATMAATIEGNTAIYGGTASTGGLKVGSMTVNSGVVTLGSAAGTGTAGRIATYDTTTDLTFEAGSALRVVGADGAIALATGRRLVMNGAILDLSEAGLTVTGEPTLLDGTVVVGGSVSGGSVTLNTLASDAALGDDVNFTLSSSLAAALNQDPTAVINNPVIVGTITNGGTPTTDTTWQQIVSNLYGDYTFSATYNAADLSLAVTSVTDITNPVAVQRRLTQMFGTPISNGYAAATVGILQNLNSWTPDGTTSNITGGTAKTGVFVDPNAAGRARASGYTSYDFFLAAANYNAAPVDGEPAPRPTFNVRDANGNPTGMTGVVDNAMLAYYNGYAANTALFAAHDTAFEGVRTLDEHIFKINRAFTAVRNESSSDALASLAMNQRYLNRFWVGGFGLWSDADAKDGMPGYRYDAGGFATGYDRAFGPVTLGGAFAYARGDYDDKSANANDSKIDSYTFDLYANYNHCSGFFATLMGGYTLSKNKIRDSRGGGTLRQDFDTDTWNLGGRVGYDFRPRDPGYDSGYSITPSIGLLYVDGRNDSHTATWENVLDLVYGKARMRSLLLPVEVRFGYDIGLGDCSKLNLNATVGYAYNFKDDTPAVAVTYVGLADQGGALGPVAGLGRAGGRHRFNIGAGFRYVAGRFDAGVNYDYFRKSGYDAHRVVGSVGVSF